MSWQAYSRLQLALAHFGQPFWMLTADQLPELERQLAHCQAQLTEAEAQIRILENGEIRSVDRNTLETP